MIIFCQNNIHSPNNILKLLDEECVTPELHSKLFEGLAKSVNEYLVVKKLSLWGIGHIVFDKRVPEWVKLELLECLKSRKSSLTNNLLKDIFEREDVSDNIKAKAKEVAEVHMSMRKNRNKAAVESAKETITRYIIERLSVGTLSESPKKEIRETKIRKKRYRLSGA